MRAIVRMVALVHRDAAREDESKIDDEGADFLESQEFEDELVRLGRAYLGYSVGKRGG